MIKLLLVQTRLNQGAPTIEIVSARREPTGIRAAGGRDRFEDRDGRRT